MQTIYNVMGITRPLCIFSAICWAGVASHAAPPFDQQRVTVEKATETQPESAIISLLEAGIAENHPAQAATLAEEWLRQNLPKDSKLLFLAARNLELAGDWEGSAALYQQFLKKSDPKSEDTSKAIIALHSLLIDQLNDTSSAYAFGRIASDRLAVNPTYRQYDRWFLDTAKSRNDREALAERLRATTKSGIPAEQLVVLYERDFQWLYQSIRSVRYDTKEDKFTDQFVSTVKELAKAIPFDEELKLLLDWSVSVKAYNMAILADEAMSPPHAEAKALLAKYPQRAEQVQTDWAGGHNGRHYRGDPKKYWSHESKAKLEPIQATIPKLTPLQQADLIKTWQTRYYDGGPDILNQEETLEFILSNPKLVNSKTGPIFSLGWEKLSHEEAAKLAPILANNPMPEASVIRAVVAGGKDKDYDKAMAALLGPEVWRLGPGELNGSYADRLWHWAGRPGGNVKRDQEVARSKEIEAKVAKETIKRDAPANQRNAEFKRLWNDYRSNSPKIPAVRSRLMGLVQYTPDAVTTLLRDGSPEAQILARNALASGVFDGKDSISRDANERVINVDRYDPLILRLANRHRGMEWFKANMKDVYAPYPLLPEIQSAISKQIKQNQVEPWLAMAWVNAQFPEDNAASVKLAQELYKSPAWKKLPPEVKFAMRSWFKEAVMSDAEVAQLHSIDPKVVFKDILALTEESDATTVSTALNNTVASLKKAPFRMEMLGLDKLALINEETFYDPNVFSAFAALIDDVRIFEAETTVGNRFIAQLAKTREPSALLEGAAYVWRNVELFHRPLANVMELTESLIDQQPEAASTLARCGLSVIARHQRGHTWFKRDSDIPRLKAVRGKTAMKMGLIEIPVAPNNPKYPAYQAQADWMTGNEDSAWDMLDENWEVFMEMHRELSPSFLLWTIQRTIYSRDDIRQEELIKALLAWSNEAGSPLTLDEKASIEIAYGDIAMQLGQLRQAHEIFTRVKNNEAYQELKTRYTAALRKIRAERMAKDFDGALETIAELELEKVPSIWTDLRFARAEVHYDMEEFDDAKDDIESILAREPNHPDGKILLGKIQLKRQKLMEATEVELGSTSDQRSLVPGERLKVTLTDPTLAVSGAGTEIEVTVWATSGDRENFFLRQFGDQKTKFRGEVDTELGKPAADDGVLQVIGDDEVYYAYSERFLKKMNQVEEKRGGPIIIASDALLMASARKLLSEAEQRTADMEAVMDQIKDKVDGNVEAAARAKLASRAMDVDARATAGELTAERMARYMTNVAKPGNPVHVRVVDPDKSRTPEIDELTVSVASSSGDSISQVTLKETGTHTGWFEGSVPTVSAQAKAFAANSEPGRNPNMVISPNDQYPAWRPSPSENTDAVEFTIDLNDNVEIGEMTLTASEPEAALKIFAVQTGMNSKSLTTVAAYPRQQSLIEKPWHPSVVVMNDTDEHHNRNERSVYDLSELQHQVERGWMTQTYAAGTAGNVAGPSEAMTESIPSQVKWLRQNRHHNSHVVYRFRGYFYEPQDVTRRFKVELGKYQIPPKTHPSVAHPPQFLLAVNGRPITNPEKPNQLEGEVNLRSGVHYFEIWATGWDCTIGFGRSVRLLANLKNADSLTECPDSFFDPETFPESAMDHRNAPATISASPDNTSFKLKFADNSRARVIRLLLLDQESPVPSLNKISLSQPDGEQILPLKEDFADLNKNDTLEILTGDKIVVRYVDDRYITKNKETHERSLNVSFTDADIEFADMQPRYSSKHGKDMPYYERLIRFKHDEPLSLAIHDADMDVSVKPDKITVKLSSQGGDTRKFEAVETGDSTGIFKVTITPVSNSGASDTEFQVAEGGTILASYLDQENNRPGVPTERFAKISHASYTDPQFRLAHAKVAPWQPEPDTNPMHTLIHGFEILDYLHQEDSKIPHERVQPRWSIENTMMLSDQAPEGGFEAVLGRTLYAELLAPQYALGISSNVEVYAQTDAGRKASGVAPDGAFDINTRGTVLLNGGLTPPVGHSNQWNRTRELPIYVGGNMSYPNTNHYDRFFLRVPLITGLLPTHGYLTRDEIEERQKQMADSRQAANDLYAFRTAGLVVQSGDRIHLGFRYTDASGEKKWLTATSKAITHPVFDVMNEDYRTPMTSAYVGENLELRVVDLGADLSDLPDSVNVLVQAKSGAKAYAELRESGPHTGIFKGSYLLTYVKEGQELTEDYDIKRDGLPVIYGDTVAARYTGSNGIKSDTHVITISKGADGSIAPFSKVYEDPDVAMRTQFSLAEAYLEMAKRHRKLGENERADQEYASAKLLLSKAMDQFTDPDTRAHAEYLLGTLTMEEAIAAEDEETKETRFRAALSRFMTVTGSYPGTLYASKAQYRIATVYEALKEPEIAAQEYVKLAYKYPDSEFLATSMARLGSHFLKKAAAYEEQAKPLLAKAEEDKDAAFQGEAMQKMAEREYIKTASIFERLQERFPSNELAGQAGLRAGQAYMRAKKNQEAVTAFEKVIAEEGYDGPKIRAQAMYWVGMCYQDLRQEMAAYSTFKRLTYDFPESKWASYARAQLSQERLLKLENELELERLEAGQ